MGKHYDFSKAKRGPIVRVAKGKTRITIRLDGDEDTSRSQHERYLDLFGLMQRRDDQLANAFNNPARSRMILQLAAIQMLDLLVPSELGRFSQETRNRIEPVAGSR